MIRFGDADIFLAGGAEASISTMGLSGFGSMKALSSRNDEPEKASRPFDKDRIPGANNSSDFFLSESGLSNIASVSIASHKDLRPLAPNLYSISL